MAKPKILAMYLPQYHCIPENDKFWGKGFTDWVSVKKAQSLYKGHYEPRVPLNNNYYDLSRKSNLVWQAKLAKDYGVDGFGIYHYWFNNEKKLLTKPAEILLNNEEIDIDFFFAWDNSNWKRSWGNVPGNDWAPSMEQNIDRKKGPIILIPYILGSEEDWKNHYNYVRSFFLDKRYIKRGNKPLFVIFNYSEDISKMCDLWDQLAQKDGFDGMFFIFRYGTSNMIPSYHYKFKYEPLFSGWSKSPCLCKRIFNKLCDFFKIQRGPKKYSYDEIWQMIISNAKLMPEKEMYHGAFVSYDDTPRRGKHGTVVIDSTPTKFLGYLKELEDICEAQCKEYIFLTAWNEWGEGAYLEPDEFFQFKYLEAIRDSQK